MTAELDHPIPASQFYAVAPPTYTPAEGPAATIRVSREPTVEVHGHTGIFVALVVFEALNLAVGAVQFVPIFELLIASGAACVVFQIVATCLVIAHHTLEHKKSNNLLSTILGAIAFGVLSDAATITLAFVTGRVFLFVSAMVVFFGIASLASSIAARSSK